MDQKKALPKVALLVCNLHDAWVVGSSALPRDARPRLRRGQLRDLDIMVPWRNWPAAAAHIPPNAVPTALGGWRWTVGRLQIDMWPDTLDRLASMDFFKAAWHPKSGIRLLRTTETEQAEVEHE